MDCYNSIKRNTATELKAKGSRFLASTHKVTSTDQVREIIATLKTEHHAARHHCYAYRIGAAGETFRANDEGEPSGTAGKPILGQIIARELSDVLVVVVRYFGGTLLGVSGLIAAYKNAAAQALDEAGIEEIVLKHTLCLTVQYDKIDPALRAIRQAQATVEQMETDAKGRCVLTISVRLSQRDELEQKLEKILIFQKTDIKI